MIYHCAVQLRLPMSERREAPGVRYLRIHGADVRITITRHRQARRYVVRVSEDGGLRLTDGENNANRAATWNTITIL